MYKRQVLIPTDDNIYIVVSQDATGIEAGSTPSLTCNAKTPSQIWWNREGVNLTTIRESDLKARLDILHAKREDSGNYTCHVKANDGSFEENRNITIKIYGEKQCTIF